jgi:hypothetical protein
MIIVVDNLSVDELTSLILDASSIDLPNEVILGVSLSVSQPFGNFRFSSISSIKIDNGCSIGYWKHDHRWSEGRTISSSIRPRLAVVRSPDDSCFWYVIFDPTGMS